MTQPPIMCALTPAALDARHSVLLSKLIKRVESREELSDGHRLRFASDDVLSLIARTVDAERPLGHLSI